eukprot:UN07096
MAKQLVLFLLVCLINIRTYGVCPSCYLDECETPSLHFCENYAIVTGNTGCTACDFHGGAHAVPALKVVGFNDENDDWFFLIASLLIMLCCGGFVVLMYNCCKAKKRNNVSDIYDDDKYQQDEEIALTL